MRRWGLSTERGWERGFCICTGESLSHKHKHKQKPQSPVTITHLIATGHRQVLRHVSSSADSLAPVPCPSLITHGYSSAKRWAIWKAVGSRSAATTITPGTDCRMAFEWPPAPKVKSRTTCWETKKKKEQKEKAKCFIHDENYFRLEQSCLMFNQTLILL